MKPYRRKQSGIALIEVVIALGIIASMLVAVGLSVTAYVSARAELLNDAKSLYLAEEGYEMIRMLRDEDWNTIDALALDVTHYFDVTATTISITSTPEVIDGEFYRSFILEEAYRDSDDDITSSTASGAVADPNTLFVTVSVGDSSGTSSLKAVIANLYAL